jgi:DNA polymerase III alpha subunit (gram-positive type)
MTTAMTNDNSKIILAFDTETTGLFPKSGDQYEIDKLPYITQLSFILYDKKNKIVLKTYNQYICIPNDVSILPFITELTGVTREKCDNGVNIIDALNEFWIAYNQSNIIIAHNIVFDIKMIEVEIIRNSEYLIDKKSTFMFNSTYNHIKNIKHLCTGNIGRNYSIVTFKSSNGNTYKKMPKLGELYELLFKRPMVGAHNSLYDTDACLQCYLEMVK